MAKKSRKNHHKKLIIPVIMVTIKLMIMLTLYALAAFWIFVALLDTLSTTAMEILAILLIFLGPGIVIYHFIKKFSRFS